MSRKWTYIRIACTFLPFMVLAAVLTFSGRGNTEDRKRPVAAKADDFPDENQIFVWPEPEDGVQSMLVLSVKDGSSFQAALLVPLDLSIKGISVSDPKTPDGKASKDALDKLIGGKLIQVKFLGRDRFGRRLVDAVVFPEEGKRAWASKAMIATKKAKGD